MCGSLGTRSKLGGAGFRAVQGGILFGGMEPRQRQDYHTDAPDPFAEGSPPLNTDWQRAGILSHRQTGTWKSGHRFKERIERVSKDTY